MKIKASAKYIAPYIQRSGRTQEELATELGIGKRNRQFLSMSKADHAVPLVHVEKLCELTGADESWLTYLALRDRFSQASRGQQKPKLNDPNYVSKMRLLKNKRANSLISHIIMYGKHFSNFQRDVEISRLTVSKYIGPALERAKRENRSAIQQISWVLDWSNTSFLSQIKSGAAKLPPDAAAPLAETIGVDGEVLFFLAVKEFFGENWGSVYTLLSKHHSDFIHYVVKKKPIAA